MSGEFPWLGPDDRFRFPRPEDGTAEGIVGAGGNLSPGMLLSAYTQGVFPWYAPGEPILWWNPDPRFVLFPDEFHLPRRLERLLRRDPFVYRLDTRFPDVITACGEVPRPGQDGTWITDDIRDGYIRLHELGYAHSLEVFDGEDLVGGLYGVALGRVFFGESMFSRCDDASKAGFAVLMQHLRSRGYAMVDCQVYTDHLARFNACEIPRNDFLARLANGLAAGPTERGRWIHPPRFTGS